jgi:ABC-2 type transport system permease protein
MRLPLYREMTLSSLRSNLTYRLEVLLYLFGQLLGIFVQVYIWYALYGNEQEISSSVGNISISEMITYVLISTFISVFATNDVIFRVSSKVVSGEIAMDLLKPMSFKSVIFCQSFGSNMYRILFEFIPMLVVSLLVFHVMLPSAYHFLIFCIMLINTLLLNFIITYVIGLISFWYGLVWQINTVLNALIRLFSGAFLPLWFFPDSVITISYFLPFRLMYYEPISVYLGMTADLDILLLILQQMGWIIGLLLLEKLLWSRAIHRLVVQGG